MRRLAAPASRRRRPTRWRRTRRSITGVPAGRTPGPSCRGQDERMDRVRVDKWLAAAPRRAPQGTAPAVRWVVFLRAVNLGARNKVPMAQLRAELEAAGYEGLRTYIASGNVLLDGPSNKARIARELERLIAEVFRV